MNYLLIAKVYMYFLQQSFPRTILTCSYAQFAFTPTPSDLSSSTNPYPKDFYNNTIQPPFPPFSVYPTTNMISFTLHPLTPRHTPTTLPTHLPPHPLMLQHKPQFLILQPSLLESLSCASTIQAVSLPAQPSNAARVPSTGEPTVCSPRLRSAAESEHDQSAAESTDPLYLQLPRSCSCSTADVEWCRRSCETIWRAGTAGRLHARSHC